MRCSLNCRSSADLQVRRPSASKHRGAVLCFPGERSWYLQDGRSANGFFVREERVPTGGVRRLAHGEVFATGQIQLRFERGRAPSPGEGPPTR
jgi:hypothetical protein